MNCSLIIGLLKNAINSVLILSQLSPYVQEPQDHVRVPQLSFVPCSHLAQALNIIDCLRDSADFGCDIY